MKAREILKQNSNHGGMKDYKPKKKQKGGSVSTGNGGYSGGIS